MDLDKTKGENAPAICYIAKPFLFMLNPNLTTSEGMSRIGTPFMRGVLRLIKHGAVLDCRFCAAPPREMNADGKLLVENPNPLNLDFTEWAGARDWSDISGPFYVTRTVTMSNRQSCHTAGVPIFEIGYSVKPGDSATYHFMTTAVWPHKYGDYAAGHCCSIAMAVGGDSMFGSSDILGEFFDPHLLAVREAMLNAIDAVFVRRNIVMNNGVLEAGRYVRDTDGRVCVSYWIGPYGVFVAVDDSGSGFNFERIADNPPAPARNNTGRGLAFLAKSEVCEVWFERLRDSFRTMLLRTSEPIIIAR